MVLSLDPQHYIDAIHEVMAELISRRDARSLFEVIARKVRELFPADATAVGMWVDGRWIIIASSGLPPEVVLEVSGKITQEESLSGRILTTGAPVQVMDVFQDPGFRFKDLAKKLDFQAFVGVPMTIAEEVIGTVELWQKTPQPLDAQSLSLLESFAAMGAVAAKSLEDFKQISEGLESAKAAFDAARILDRRRGDFLSHLSHELRSPMVMIQGWLELILRGQYGELTPKQKHGLQVALRNTDKLVTLVDNVKSAGRLTTTTVALRRQPVLVSALLSEALKEVHPLAREHAVTLNAEVDLEPDTLGEMDHDKVLQSVVEVLSNAITHSPRSGSVRLWAAMAAGRGDKVGAGLRVWADQRQVNWSDLLVVSVHDDGPGIGNDVRDRLQLRFYTDAANGNGTGLKGLPLVKETMNLHEGDLFIEAPRGEGTLVRLAWPLKSTL